MIFAPSIARAALRGEVTQVRRPYVARDPYYRRSTRLRSTSSHVLVKPYRPGDGDRFPIQQRITRDGRQTVETKGHGIIGSAVVVRAGELTLQDAREMGYRTTSEAMAGWLCQYDQGWTCEKDVVDNCQACGGPGVAPDGFCVTCGCDDQAAARFTAKHADREVWLIRFRLDTTHVPRLLAASPSAESDYVTSPSLALAEEPEALSAVEHERHVQGNAGMTHEQWRALEQATRDAELEKLSLGQRLDRAIAEAQREGRSMTREINVIEKRLRALEQPQKRAA